MHVDPRLVYARTGGFIAQHRLARGFSQHQLATRVGVTAARICQIESGDFHLKLATAQRVFEILEMCGETHAIQAAFHLGYMEAINRLQEGANQP
jgi:predicted transcriptional regulator